MKRIIIYCIILAALWFVPVRGHELGKMIPVEAVYLYHNEGNIVIETDTGNHGSGSSVESAIQNLTDGAPGIIFLDTAEYLLISENAEEYVPLVKSYLKSGTYICIADGEVELGEAALYLSAHTPAVTLKEWYSGIEMDELYVNEGQMYLR